MRPRSWLLLLLASSLLPLLAGFAVRAPRRTTVRMAAEKGDVAAVVFADLSVLKKSLFLDAFEAMPRMVLANS